MFSVLINFVELMITMGEYILFKPKIEKKQCFLTCAMSSMKTHTHTHTHFTLAHSLPD